MCHPKLNSTLDANLTWLNEILHSFKLRGQGVIKNRAHFYKIKCFKNATYHEMFLIEVVLLFIYSYVKIIFRKIRLIFGMEY